MVANKDPFIEVVNILDKHKRLAGNKRDLTPNDRECTAEIVKLIRKYVYEAMNMKK